MSSCDGIDAKTWVLIATTVISVLLFVTDEILGYRKGSNKCVGDVIRRSLIRSQPEQPLVTSDTANNSPDWWRNAFNSS